MPKKGSGPPFGSAREPSLLAGLIHDGAGERMTPTHANKKGRRYRYYVLIKRGRPKASDSARRVPAGDIERLVQERIEQKTLASNRVERKNGVSTLSQRSWWMIAACCPG